MSKQLILIVEDDRNIVELVSINLRKEGYDVIAAPDGESALRKARVDSPACILLDLMLPGVDGLEICKTLKNDAATRHIPVIMVTAKTDESDIVAGLELGADDYITKPFSPRVLVARLRAVLRRHLKQAASDDAPIAIHDLKIHPGRHEVIVKGESVTLTFLEFKVLHFLAARPGWVFTRYQIVEAVRGDNYPVIDRSVDVVIVGLRKKLGESGNYIETVRGIGYRFKETKE
ncbi:MAG: response regulator transcription factor [Chitinivibrionales bacterium]|nr:response regulator transcription factor [Chitinivibrionales bacterium]